MTASRWDLIRLPRTTAGTACHLADGRFDIKCETKENNR